MSTDHRKPVVAFVMLALAVTLLIGAQQAEAQGGRLLAAAAGVGAHVQGTVVPPTETIGSRGYDRLLDLGPAFVSVREAVGHADARTVAPVTQKSRSGQPAASAPRFRVRTADDADGSTDRFAIRSATGAEDGRAGAGSGRAGFAAARAGATAGRTGKSSGSDAAPSGPARSGPGKSGPGRSAPGRSAPSGRSGTSSPAPGKKVGHADKARRVAGSWKPGRAHGQATKASPRSAAAHRSARPATRPARVATTSRATGVHPSTGHHRGGRGKR